MRIRVKVGESEVEYEGSPGFLKKGLPQLLDLMSGGGGTEAANSKPQKGGTGSAAGTRAAKPAAHKGARTASQILQDAKGNISNSTDRTLLLAYWLEKHDNKTTWTTRNVSAAYAAAHSKEPANIPQTVLNLVKRGLVGGENNARHLTHPEGIDAAEALLTQPEQK